MDLKTIHTDKYEAFEKWREYVAAFKRTGNPMDKDLRDIYREAKQGHKIIDIADVIKAGGNRWEKDGENNHVYPNLAIARASDKQVHCRYWTNGTVSYQPWERHVINLPICLPTFTISNRDFGNIDLCAPVPLIPSGVWNNPILNYHYILWHVDKWEPVPSEDPALLRRITKNLFVVLATWDLTPLEMAVMKNYI